jgi:hypothetical protein
MSYTAAVVIVAAIVGVPVYFRFIKDRGKSSHPEKPSSRPATAIASAYRPPRVWSERRAGTTASLGYTSAQRAEMPPFTLWYRSEEFEPKTAPDGWASVVDGNHTLPSHSPLPNFIQRKHFRLPNGKSRLLALFAISPETAASLNQGPLRQIMIKATLHPEAFPMTLTVPAGVPSGQFTPSPLQPNGERGSSDWGTPDDLANLGAVRSK